MLRTRIDTEHCRGRFWASGGRPGVGGLPKGRARRSGTPDWPRSRIARRSMKASVKTRLRRGCRGSRYGLGTQPPLGWMDRIVRAR